ncbi:MAG: molybdenum cofactor biosynthesis protein MoaE [Anaerolineales bacterium]|nr:molybdenum cofactor biosynthesis protein MoaE [Anaerolineales bacterium]MDW8161016.1 molybdenum cofactor biosynthesis protein MoaE [Anaerolineales bacterium]
MNIRVLYFATYKQKIGKGEENFSFEAPLKVEELKHFLRERYPDSGLDFSRILVAVNKEYAFDDDLIPDGAEVAIFPPVSGGESVLPTILELTEKDFDIDAILRQLVRPTTGGSCVFVGFVREVTTGELVRQTSYLEYEAYEEMAKQKMLQVVREIRTRWPEVEGVAIIQRLGHLDPGTPTVLVACTAAHRDRGIFEAARYGIDRVKEIVPVWKKEVGPAGEVWVEGEYFPRKSDTVV